MEIFAGQSRVGQSGRQSVDHIPCNWRRRHHLRSSLTDRYFYAIKPDGSLRWKLTPEIYPAIGSFPAIGADGTICSGGADGSLYAVGAAAGSRSPD
jgi:outer membrane protein assembly factor BamB